MAERNRNEPEECRLQKESANKTDFLTVHGYGPACLSLSPRVAWTNAAGYVSAAPPAPFQTCRKQKPAANVPQPRQGFHSLLPQS
ncbi:Ribonuclease I [Enterobacter cancerogenus]|uniref:Ribonuclease I n=1 Tax=Enterobacter cancerogenus TaxID=69218 RepID=A0A484X1P8_9ENTR|nr:Ribonuclease I [Enterobacter cancerogenus]